MNNKIVLEHINFELKSNQIITIIGPNGSGKTSLIKLIIRLIKPSSGQIYIKKNLKIGYVPQKFIANPIIPITAGNFLKIQCKLSKSTHLFTKIIEIFRVTHLLDHQLSTLSGGELQKIMLARSMLVSPDVLILDEPTQGVDTPGQIYFYKLMNELKDQFNLSIILVSHDLHFVMKQTNLVLCLNKHICCMGTPLEISNNVNYQHLFGRDAANVMSLYSHEHDHQHNFAD